MNKEGSVAPRERVNITYKPATGDANAEVELPFKMVMVGDYTLRPDPRPLEQRGGPLRVDKDNFDEVLRKQQLQLDLAVPDALSGREGDELGVSLKFETLASFAPEAVAEQVPELKTLLELRQALIALKGPLGNVPAFRKKIQGLLGDEGSRQKLMQELGLSEGKNEG